MLPSDSVHIIAQWLDLPSVKFYRVENFNSVDSLNKITQIYLERDFSGGFVCCNCGSVSHRRWDSERVRLRDLSLFEYKTYLILDKYRIECVSCGVKTERLPFAEPYSRCTKRFEEYVARLCKIASIKQVAELLDLDWKTVKEIDKKYLEEQFKEPDFSDLELVGVDEISSRKGHNYFTVVMNLKKGKVIWVGKGRKKETLDQFFKELGPERASKIKAIALDMWDPYIASINEHAPQAEIVFDKFHVISNFSKVIDKVRNTEYHNAKREHKEIIKGTKYLLLSNRSSLGIDQKKQLGQLLGINENINLAYILKDDLKRLWDYKYPKCAERLLNNWIERAKLSGSKPLVKFAKTLERYRYGLINHCRYPIDNGKLEGMNNKIKVVKRIAYGFHDDDYFILKIKQACSGKEPGSYITKPQLLLKLTLPR